MKVKELLAQENVVIDKNSTTKDVLTGLARISPAIMALVPGLSEVYVALQAADTACSTARELYETATSTYTKAKEALDDFNAAQATAKGDASGASYTAAKAAKTLAKSASDAADKAVSTATENLKDAILNTEVATIE